MKGYAIKTETIGNYQIITGLKPLSIDPRATQKAASVMIFGTQVDGDGNDGIPELEPLQRKQEESNRLLSEIAQTKTQAKKLLAQSERQKSEIKTLIDPKAIANRESEYKVTVKALGEQDRIYKLKSASFEQCQEDLKPLVSEFNQASKEIIRLNPVFCEPNAGEYVDPDTPFAGGTAAELDAMDREVEDQDGNKIPLPKISVDGMDVLIQRWMNKTETEQICIDGESVADFRGKQWFYNDGSQWIESEVVTDLGVTVETVVVDAYQDQAVEKADLTPEQLEEIRLQNLTAEQKTAEKESSLAGALTKAGVMRNELEIQGEPDALKISQAWYQEQVTAIEAKYA